MLLLVAPSFCPRSTRPFSVVCPSCVCLPIRLTPSAVLRSTGHGQNSMPLLLMPLRFFQPVQALSQPIPLVTMVDPTERPGSS